MKTRMFWIAGALLALSLPFAVACGDSGSTDAPDARPIITDIDSGVVDAGPPDGSTPTSDAGCITNPTTHAELMNGCTDSVKISKHPTLPRLNPDGTLPPLP